MDTPTLIDGLNSDSSNTPECSERPDECLAPRLRLPNRTQRRWEAWCLDERLASASAGRHRFRRRERLEQFQQEVRERMEKIDQALEQMAELEEAEAQEQKRKARKSISPARVSTTDPEARKMKMANGGPCTHHPKDSPAVAEWRARMQTDEGKEVYRQRASTSETINGDLKTHRGLDRFHVRGLQKAQCVALWSALAYNIIHFAEALIR